MDMEHNTQEWVPHFKHVHYKANLSGNVLGQFGRILKPKLSKSGYCEITIRGNYYLLHRFIYEVFTGKVIPEGLQINHIDGNKSNNQFANLQLVTPSENIIHSIRTGLRKVRVGSSVGGSILTEDKVREIKILLHSGTHLQKDIASMYGVSRSTISDIKRGLTWKHVSILDITEE